jgi:hypothetical protein
MLAAHLLVLLGLLPVVFCASWVVQKNFNVPDCPDQKPAPLIEHVSYLTGYCSNYEMVTCNETNIVFWDYCDSGCNKCYPKTVYGVGKCLNWYDSNSGIQRSISYSCEKVPFDGLTGWIVTRSFSSDGCEEAAMVNVQSVPPRLCIPIGSGNWFNNTCNSTYSTQTQCNCGDRCGGLDFSYANGLCHNYSANTWMSDCAK